MINKRILALLGLSLLLSACVPLALGGGMTAGVVGLQERTVGKAVDDSRIWSQIKSNYVQNDVNKLLTSVNVTVTEGRVLLTGTVDNPETRVNAVRLAWQPEGVAEVINEIEVLGSQNFKSFAQDGWITTNVKSRLLLEENVRSVNYTIETVNRVVYLMGIAQSQKELNLATKLASTIKGVKKVVSYVRIKSNSSSSSNAPSNVGHSTFEDTTTAPVDVAPIEMAPVDTAPVSTAPVNIAPIE